MCWGKSAIKRVPKVARSRAVVVWPASVRPSGFLKLVDFMPKRAACSFISCTKRSTVPPTPSARTTVASLPDCTTMPLIRSSTGTFILGSMNMREPGMRQALGLTGRAWFKSNLRARKASNTK